MASAMTCVQPSAIAARKGIVSNTAASTILRPRCVIGSPATCGTMAEARRHSLRSAVSLKFSKSTGCNVSRQDATTCRA